MKALRESVDSALKRAFRPEFLNRIDDTIVFHPLNEDHIVQIVELMARDVQERLRERNITFELTREAELWLANEGFDPVYGARPLRRAVQRQLENPLARMVLSGEIEEGAHVLVDAGSSGLTLTNQDVQVDTGNETAEPALV
jgi:ATP-dependent Clp protease ATP-binding subunit ClpC